MKLRITSDWHLEMLPDAILSDKMNLKHYIFNNILDFPKTKDETLVLAGDLLYSRDIKYIKNVFSILSEEFANVYFILGNHDYWHSKISDAISDYQEASENISNVYILQNKSVITDDVVFLGGTLWTDYGGKNPLYIQTAQSYMVDFRKIISSDLGWEVKPYEILYEFDKCMDWLTQEVQKYKDKHIVIVTHHLPSFSSIHPKYLPKDGMDRQTLNHAFASNLDGFILSLNGKSVTWIHGHTHSSCDYKLGNTRVLCNPYGYTSKKGDVENLDYNKNLILEV